MNVAGFVRTVLAKPLVLVVLVVVTAAAGAVGWSSTSPHYVSGGAVLVIPPGAGNTDAGRNPFANLNGGPPLLAHVLATSSGSPEARDKVAATGAQPDYQLSTLAGDSSSFNQLSPQITFQVSGPDPETAQRGSQALVAFMREELRKMQVQAGVADGTFADLRVTVEAQPGTEVPAKSARTAASYGMAAAALVIIALLVVTAVRQQLLRRRVPAVAAPGAAPAPATAPAAAAPAPHGEVPAADGATDRAAPDEGRPPRPRRIAPPQRPVRSQPSQVTDWSSDEEPLPAPTDETTPAGRSSRRPSPQVRWARPANRDDPARPKV